MAKTKKVVNALSISALAGIMASTVLSSVAFAAVDAYTVKVGDNVFEYNTAELQESFLASKAGDEAVLYTDFAAKLEEAKGFYAFHDAKTNRYIAFDNVTNAFLGDRENFKLNDYVETDKAVAVTNLPTVIKAVKVVGGEIKLEDKSIGEQAQKLVIGEAKADNLKEIKIAITGTVDKATLKTSAFAVAKAGHNVDLEEVTLVDNTIVLTVVGNLDNQDEYKVTIDGLKDGEGTSVDKVEKTFKTFDAVLPEAQSIKITGPRSIEIEFNEPIKEKGEISIKAGTSVIGSSIKEVNGNVAVVDLYSELKDGTSYEVTVKNFKDYALYNNAVKTLTLDYVAVKEAPTATITKVDQKYVVVEFNRPVKGLAKENFYHSFSAWTAQGVYSDSKMTTEVASNIAYNKVYVKFASLDADGKLTGYPLKQGENLVTIKSKANDVEVKDNWNNVFAGQTITATAAADTTAPEVTELKVSTGTELTIKLSEEVKFTKDNVEILDSEGKKIDGVSVSVKVKDADEYSYTISTGKDLTGKTVIVNIKNVEDTALTPNKLSLYTATIQVTDTKKPEATKVTKVINLDKDSKITGGSLYVFFSEEVDGTALDVNNYSLQDKTEFTVTKLTKAPSFYDGSKVVKIDLTASQAENVNSGNYYVAVNNVKDMTGNVMVGKVLTTISTNADTSATVKSVEATSVNTIKVTFDSYLTRVDNGAFTINATTPAAMSLSTNDKGNTVVTLTAKDSFNYDATNAELKVTPTDTFKLLNIFGVNATGYTGIASDSIAPTIAKVDDKLVTAANEGASAITIKFTEKLDAASLSKYTFKVKDYDVNSVSLDADGLTVVITVDTTGDSKVFVKDQVLEVTQVQALSDKAGNDFKYDKTLEVKAQ